MKLQHRCNADISKQDAILGPSIRRKVRSGRDYTTSRSGGAETTRSLFSKRMEHNAVRAGAGSAHAWCGGMDLRDGTHVYHVPRVASHIEIFVSCYNAFHLVQHHPTPAPPYNISNQGKCAILCICPASCIDSQSLKPREAWP